MGEAIERLAHFIAGTPWDAIPEPVRAHAKLVFAGALFYRTCRLRQQAKP